MFRILVVDDMPVVREPVMSVLKANGYDVVGASSGMEALEFARSGHLDAILLDLVMPGMDGIATLEAIRHLPAHKNTRVILLTASGDRDQILQAAKLGVRDYILKSSFIMKDLLGRLGKYLQAPPNAPVPPAPAPPPAAAQTPHPAPADRKVNNLREATLRRISDAQVKTLPGTVGELLALTSSARCDASEVANCLKRDPVLSMRILRVANSAAFASARARIGTMEEAVRHIGLREIHRVAASVGIFDTFGGAQAGLALLHTWQHSLAVGRLMETFAARIEGCDAGLAYTIGLCHDLPDIMLHQYLPAEALTIANLMQAGCPRRQAEADVMGMSYAETARHWLPQLRLHGSISGPILAFFSASAAGTSAFHGDIMATLLYVAEEYANAVMLGRCLQDEEVGPITRLQMQTIPGDLPALDPQSVRLDATSVLGMLGDFSAADIRRAAGQPLPRTPLCILYVRGERYAEFDPLKAALDLLADQVTQAAADSLAPGDLAGFDAAVIVDADVPALHGDASIPVLKLTSNSLNPGDSKQAQHRLPVALGALSAFLEQARGSLTGVPPTRKGA